jgi:hypothetical protein
MLLKISPASFCGLTSDFIHRTLDMSVRLQAEATLKRCGCFAGTQKFADASELFLQAGAQYKAADSCTSTSIYRTVPLPREWTCERNI